MRIALLTLLLLICTACSHSPEKLREVSAGLPSVETERREQQMLEKGMRHYVAGDYSRAARHFESLFSLSGPANIGWSRYLLYYCYVALGEYHSALLLAENLVKEQPFQSLPYQQLGFVQMSLGEYQKANQSFQKALEFESHAPRVLFYRGVTLAHLQNPAEKEKAFSRAEQEYRQILVSNPTDFTANYELAALYLYWNKHVDQVPPMIIAARNGLAQSTEAEIPQDRKLYHQYYLPVLEGILLHRKQDARGSLHLLFDAINVMPSGVKADLAEIYHYIGKNYLILQEKESARLFLERALYTDPKGAYALEIQSALKNIN